MIRQVLYWMYYGKSCIARKNEKDQCGMWKKQDDVDDAILTHLLTTPKAPIM